MKHKKKKTWKTFSFSFKREALRVCGVSENERQIVWLVSKKFSCFYRMKFEMFSNQHKTGLKNFLASFFKYFFFLFSSIFQHFRIRFTRKLFSSKTKIIRKRRRKAFFPLPHLRETRNLICWWSFNLDEMK